MTGLPVVAAGGKLAGVLGFAKTYRWLLIGLAIALAIGAAVWWHAHKVSNFGDEKFAEGVAHEQARMTAEVKRVERQRDALAAKLRSLNNEKIRRVADHADALRVRGPGKATCFYPAAPAAGGHIAADRPADAALAPVPDGRGPAIAAVPFADLVTFAEQHDKCRIEALGWREGQQLQVEAWKKQAGEK